MCYSIVVFQLTGCSRDCPSLFGHTVQPLTPTVQPLQTNKQHDVVYAQSCVQTLFAFMQQLTNCTRSYAQ